MPAPPPDPTRSALESQARSRERFPFGGGRLEVQKVLHPGQRSVVLAAKGVEHGKKAGLPSLVCS